MGGFPPRLCVVIGNPKTPVGRVFGCSENGGITTFAPPGFFFFLG